jgi:putative redox protein
MKAEMTWIKEMEFMSDNHGVKTLMDATPEHGGAQIGPTPKELILNAMMGCTAMDVVSMLKKMRQEISEFKMEIEAVKTTHYPTHFKSAELVYLIKGNIDPEKAIKAVDASLTKYCGVNYMISKTCQLTFKLVLNDHVIKTGPVQFIEPKPEE